VSERHVIEVEIEQLNAIDLYWRKDELAKREAELRADLKFITQDERAAMMAVVRSTLIRLASDDSWMPGAVAIRKGHIEMHIRIDLTDLDTMVHMADPGLVLAAMGIKERLLALAERLETMGD
jgi:hypothetical protein